eukprot:UN15600
MLLLILLALFQYCFTLFLKPIFPSSKRISVSLSLLYVLCSYVVICNYSSAVFILLFLPNRP